MRITIPQSITTLQKHLPSPPVAWALFTEFILIALFGFAALLSIEMLLPTFVSARINLALCFGIILAAFVLHTFLSSQMKRETAQLSKSVFWLLASLFGLWGITLLALSLIKFPLVAGILIVLSVVICLALLRKA